MVEVGPSYPRLWKESLLHPFLTAVDGSTAEAMRPTSCKCTTAVPGCVRRDCQLGQSACATMVWKEKAGMKPIFFLSIPRAKTRRVILAPEDKSALICATHKL